VASTSWLSSQAEWCCTQRRLIAYPINAPEDRLLAILLFEITRSQILVAFGEMGRGCIAGLNGLG
jgi:hypothetical protein